MKFITNNKPFLSRFFFPFLLGSISFSISLMVHPSNIYFLFSFVAGVCLAIMFLYTFDVLQIRKAKKYIYKGFQAYLEVLKDAETIGEDVFLLPIVNKTSFFNSFFKSYVDLKVQPPLFIAPFSIEISITNKRFQLYYYNHYDGSSSLSAFRNNDYFYCRGYFIVFNKYMEHLNNTIEKLEQKEITKTFNDELNNRYNVF